MVMVGSIILFTGIEKIGSGRETILSYGLNFPQAGSLFMIFFLVLVIPWYRIFYFLVPLLLSLRIKHLRAIFRLALTGVSVAGIFALALYLLPEAMQKTIAIVLFLLMAFLFGYSLIRYAILRGLDFRNLKSLQSRRRLSRHQISEQFKQFKTNEGRLKYVLFLQTEGIGFDGIWPDGQIPNFKNDEAGALLAQLEEKRLGLDR
jgi:hypothetical protein